MDDFEALPILPARRASLRWSARYHVGPLSPLSDSSTPSVAKGIRAGALAGLAVVAALGVPFFLVLGAKAPSSRNGIAIPSAQAAKVWTQESEVMAPTGPTVVAVADAIRQTPVQSSEVAQVAAIQPPLGPDLIPVLDDESGDLSFEVPALAVKPPVRPIRGSVNPRP